MSVFYRAKHILLDEPEDTDFILEKLDEGVSFEQLARDYSSCPTANKGGDLGRFPSGSMLPEFERAIYNMKINEIRTNVKTKFGYHIIIRLE